MAFSATPVRASKESVLPQARGKGGLLGKLIVRESLFQVTLEYKKYYLVYLPYTIEARKFPFRKKNMDGRLVVVVDALSGSCGVKEKEIELEQAEGVIFQNGINDMSESEAATTARDFANRILLRLCRNFPTFGELEIDFFYRPHWMAYYGDPATSAKPRYLPFEADGLTFRR